MFASPIPGATITLLILLVSLGRRSIVALVGVGGKPGLDCGVETSEEKSVSIEGTGFRLTVGVRRGAVEGAGERRVEDEDELTKARSGSWMEAECCGWRGCVGKEPEMTLVAGFI